MEPGTTMSGRVRGWIRDAESGRHAHTLELAQLRAAGSVDADEVDILPDRDNGGLVVHPVEIAHFLHPCEHTLSA